MPSGLDRLEGHLKEFLTKGGRLRLLTGDYLGVTEPDALVRLLDLTAAKPQDEPTPRGKSPSPSRPAAR